MNPNVVPDAILEAIVGPGPMLHLDVMKKLKKYIADNKLQSEKVVVADAKLKRLFGGLNQIPMEELHKHVNNRLARSTQPVSDPAKRDALRELLLGMNIQPCVSVQLFFDGNEDRYSMGYNLGPRHPGLSSV